MPRIGLGTWKSAPGEVGAAVREALRLGYRHVDCAKIYGNEAEIGAALADSMRNGDVKREQLWITSKLWNDAHAPEHVRPALEATLRDLRLEHLDLYLIHWPVALRHGTLGPETAADFLSLEERPLADTWAAMVRLREAGLCRHVGVSNFSRVKVRGLIDAGLPTPEVNQVELHPYLQQRELLAFCADHGIDVTAYSPLGSRDRPDTLKAANEPVLLEDPAIAEIANRHGATPAQVLLAWGVQRGTAVIPKSVNPVRLRENLAAASLALSDADMQTVASLDRHRRYVDGTFWVREGGPYTVAGIWDKP